MRVSIADRVSPGSPAAFTSAIGAGVGRWCGESAIDAGQYDVEFEAPGQFGWSSDIRISESRSGLFAAGDRVVLVGDVVAAEDRVLSLSLAAGAVVMLSLRELPEDVVGKRIEASVPSLDLYPTSI
jgi:hypothetical protein